MTKRVLVCDDDRGLRETWADAFREEGFDVAIAGNGREAIAAARSRPPDVAIIDLIMPEKEGGETIVELRALNPAMKIVAVSGGGAVGTDVFLVAARRLGADASLKKPVDIYNLIKILKSLFDC